MASINNITYFGKKSLISLSKFGFFSQIVFLNVLIGCQSSPSPELNSNKASEGFNPQQAEKLYIVDCLLPGQIRQLGGQVTYVSRRRPIKTTAGDCELRGGEYVAYDRANYATALKIWLPKALEGDAEAQVTVGEIYEKGLGTLADPKAAAAWYLKAAMQGNSRAQINLGYLYEKGLGVKQDAVTALNWYRKASGLESTDLQFASVTDPSQTDIAQNEQNQSVLDKTRKESEKYKAEAEGLRKQLGETEQRLVSEKDKLIKLQNQLNDTQNELNEEKGKSSRNYQKIQSLRNDLKAKQANIISQQQQVAQIENKITKETKLIVAKSDLQTKPKTVKASEKATRLSDNKKAKPASKKLKKDSPSVTGKGPVIEITDPPLAQTRSAPSFQLQSSAGKQAVSGKVLAALGLKSLEINKQAIKTDENGAFMSEINIEAPTTEVTVTAVDKEGNSNTMTFNLISEKEEKSVTEKIEESQKTQSSSYPKIDFGRFYALIIGNNNYQNLDTLKTSVNDAKSINNILRSRYGYQTTLLTNASAYQILTALDNLRKTLNPKDNLIIYYAGHGEIDQNDKSAYWLPVDAEKNNRANWLSNQQITQYTSIIKAKHILVIADSCYSGAMTKSSITRIPKNMPEEKREKWLNFMLNRKARTVMSSGGLGPVLDSGGGGHSIFANALIRALQSNQGLMEDYQLYSAVAGKVKRAASAANFNQSPQYSALQHAGHEGSPFFFVPLS